MKIINKLIPVIIILTSNISAAQEIITEDFKALPEPIISNAGEYYGQSVSNDGDFAIIGAPLYKNQTGRAYLLHNSGMNWETVAILTASDGNEGDSFGYSVSISGNTVVVGAYGDDKFTGSVYVYEIPASNWTNMTESAKLSASNSEEGDYFGYSANIDGEVIVVGAYKANDNNGSVYLFEKPVSGWTDMTQKAVLSVRQGYEPHNFGFYVDISDTVVVASSIIEGNNGSAYIFAKPETGWDDMTHTARIIPDDQFTYFGYSIGISGNVIVVGSLLSDVYVYEFSNGWTDIAKAAKLTSSFNTTMHGKSVAIDDQTIVVGAENNVFVYTRPNSGWADMNETGILYKENYRSYNNIVNISDEVIFVGTVDENSEGNSSGSAYVYTKPSGGWKTTTESQKTLPIEPYPNNSLDYFGTSVAIYGNYSVVGSPNFNSKGCAYVLHKNGSGWEKVAKLTANDGSATDWFGESVAFYENTIVVGAPYDDIDDIYDCGSAYVFEMPLSGWADMTQTAKLTPSDGHNYNYMGKSVSISNNTIACGAIRNNEVGAIYIYEKQSGGWADMTQTAKLTSSNEKINGRLGISVSIYEDVIVGGAYSNDGNKPGSGAAYVYVKPSTGWADMTQTAMLTASDGEGGDHFGLVSSYKDIMVVGAYSDDRMGSAYIFEKPVNGWEDMKQTAKLTTTERMYDDSFGHSVDIYENEVVIGAPYHENGAAYIFKKPENGWHDMSQTKKIVSSDIGLVDNFGGSISIYGDMVVAGAHLDDDNGFNAGAVYFYNNILEEKITAITELKEASIYPNPAKKFLNINGLDKKPATAGIYDLSGKLLGNYIIDNQTFIDISHLKTGLYILNVEQNGKVLKQKFIKANN